MKVRYILLTGLLKVSTFADDTVDFTKVPGTVSLVKIKKTVEIQAPSKDTIHWQSLDRFSVTPAESDPKSFIIAGRVVSINTGAPWERLPIFFSSHLHAPRLAALSDADGRFRFRVWLKRDDRESELQVSALADGIIYLGGQFDDRKELTFGLCRTYNIVDLQRPIRDPR